MKTLTVIVTDDAFAKASVNASQHGTDVANLCSIILCEHFSNSPQSTFSATTKPTTTNVATPVSKANLGFNVSQNFTGFPHRSIEFAQKFVDRALSFPSIVASRVRRGIGFKPNFVFIEYLLSQGGRSGIVVSFYGTPSSLGDTRGILRQSRAVYCRSIPIISNEDLNYVLQFIPKAYELRFGKAK